MNKITILLGGFTLFFFGIGGILIIELLQDQRISQVLGKGFSFPYQLAIGVLTGSLAAGIALFVISRKFFQKEKAFYYGLISKLDLNLVGIIFLSLCAGIGEELFFRAGIQHFLGIWRTSVFFVFLHGYLNPKNIRISIYGLAMVGIIGSFGYLFKYIGIFSAIAAHAVFDMVLFWTMIKNNN
jgi:membrane protease YdiL (CAAX protease family)